MSFKRARRRFLAFLALFIATTALGACGFQPLYGQNATGVETQRQLGKIFIQPIADRTGQVLRATLSRALKPRARNSAPAYDLIITLDETLQTLAVEQDAFATRANLTLNATFTLMRRDDQKTLTNGTASAIASYNILSSEFATKAAKDDARTRAGQDLAATLRTRIAIYFQGRGQNQPPLRR